MSCILTKYCARKTVYLSLRCLHVSRCLPQNHYELLSVSKSASQEEIKKAYFAQSKENHPDRHPNDEQKLQKFLKINDAYSVLSNPEARQKYDQSLYGGSSYSSSYNSEKYSSAYRNHPFTRQRYASSNRDHYHSEEPRYWSRRDRLDMYWDSYYNNRSKYKGNYRRKVPNDPILSFLEKHPLSLIQYFILILMCLLSVRFFARKQAAERRSTVEEIEERRHMEVKKRADEALEINKQYKEHLQKKKSDVISNSELEEA